MPDPQRPAAVTEIRAWLLAGIAVAAHTVAISWWGATLTAKVDYTNQLAASLLLVNKELELRVRNNEQEIRVLKAQLDELRKK